MHWGSQPKSTPPLPKKKTSHLVYIPGWLGSFREWLQLVVSGCIWYSFPHAVVFFLGGGEGRGWFILGFSCLLQGFSSQLLNLPNWDRRLVILSISGNRRKSTEGSPISSTQLSKLLNLKKKGSISPSKIEWDVPNGPLAKLLELLDTKV